jgi:5-methyltetrahydrofolate--homocysteine methyltransferase
MLSFRERLGGREVIISDGAIGTMLLERGLRPGDCPERVNLESPEILGEIASSYLNAGAEIVQTNTFGASALKLSSYGLDRKMHEINCRAVEAVRKVVRDRAYVAASCGPSGRILQPYGDTSPDAVCDSFRQQMSVLVAEGVDIVLVETMTDLNEAMLAVRAARSVSSTIPVCVTMTYDATAKGFYTIMGATISQTAQALEEAGADVIGSNCGNGILNMIKIAGEFSTQTSLPLIIQSNAGIPVLRDGATFFPESPEFMAEQCTELLRIGVKIVGGCCGTTPEHIAKMRTALKESA